MDLKATQTQALTVKLGPTESGFGEATSPVGGEIFPVDKISVFLSGSWILILFILLLPVAFILYRKRDVTLKISSPLIYQLFESTRRF